MTAKPNLIPEAVMEQATDWIFRLEAAPGDTTVKAGLEAWRAENDLHERAWAVVQKTWRVSGHARPAFAHEWPDMANRLTAARGVRPKTAPRAAFCRGRASQVRRPRRALAAAALVACLALLVSLPAIQLNLAADYTTATGKTREVTLEDGSTVHLAAASAIAATYSTAKRNVTLLRGEAFFRVVADRHRTFTVTADDLTVAVTGTAFDVGFTDRTFSVAVANGAVRVTRSGEGDAGPFELGPGQGLTIDRTSGVALATTPATGSVAAWRAGRLVVENQPMAEAVEAIRRYHRGLIVISDSGLKESRVTGVYDLNDPIRALRALAASYGGVVREITPFLIVVSAG